MARNYFIIAFRLNDCLKYLVLEVGVPSIYSGQAHRHGVEAPRDFEFIPQPQAISHHLQRTVKGSRFNFSMIFTAQITPAKPPCPKGKRRMWIWEVSYQTLGTNWEAPINRVRLI